MHCNTSNVIAVCSIKSSFSGLNFYDCSSILCIMALRGSQGIGGQKEGVGKGASLDYTKV
jgi:hypothetical protein